MPRKPRADKGAKREIGVKRERMQAVLRSNEARQASAMEVYRSWRAQGHKDTYILTEALCALGEMTDKGWQAAPSLTQVKINADMYHALTQLQAHIKKLANMDFTSAGGRVEAQDVIAQAQNFTVNALGLTGAVMMFDEDED